MSIRSIKSSEVEDQTDLLSDVLRQAGLRRRLLDVRRLEARVALRFPCERSLGLHLVTQGRVHVHASALEAPLALGPGDIALMARGCAHVLSPQADLAQADAVQDLAFSPAASTAGPVPIGTSAVISGAFQLWNTPIHPLFHELPGWFVVRADEMPRLGPLSLTTSLLSAELEGRGLGSATIVQGLFDVVFAYLLRELQGRTPNTRACWSQAAGDPQIHKVLALLHGDSARAWTLEQLAAAAGLSRTGLAQRFRLALGDTPLSYLRTLRMQKAMRLLSETERNLEQLAAEVGYTDAFSFSKVFKREVGVSPREFRRRDRADAQSPWRIHAS